MPHRESSYLPEDSFPEVSTLSTSDALLDAIHAYRSGLADFIENAPEDDDEANAYADTTYCGPMLLLEGWSAPAASRGSALAALKLACDAHAAGDRGLVGPMILAALGYFEGGR
ncbi:hypothetical protein [Sinorhizobium sp. BG8]|uniref:hypothetical protein n=1 Tax=Sinorhizobium sp. BG8 TaxID=2613773 RepID=UPI00193D82B8|nr:hypothetical protein [Sinorhizobium sp. BG8]QRM55125.1 hypothetical protein F3Y30_11720 [Sinorhizobium sp. BG8]